MKLVQKSNGGQLSAFNEAVKHVTGDIVFFLDSDDIWLPDYVEHIVGIYEATNTDFVSCAMKNFGASTSTRRIYKTSRDLGYSAALTYFMKAFIGSQTSSISIKRKFLKKLFPIPLENEWPVSADFPLVSGASLAGARKYYCSVPLVLYRMHEKNAHKIDKSKDEYRFKNLYRRCFQIEYFLSKFHLSENVFSHVLDFEIRTRKNCMDRKTFLRYLRIIFYTRKSYPWKFYEVFKLISVNLSLFLWNRSAP